MDLSKFWTNTQSLTSICVHWFHLCKGYCHKIFYFRLASFHFFPEICKDIRSSRCTTGINDTGVYIWDLLRSRLQRRQICHQCEQHRPAATCHHCQQSRRKLPPVSSAPAAFWSQCHRHRWSMKTIVPNCLRPKLFSKLFGMTLMV